MKNQKLRTNRFERQFLFFSCFFPPELRYGTAIDTGMDLLATTVHQKQAHRNSTFRLRSKTYLKPFAQAPHFASFGRLQLRYLVIFRKYGIWNAEETKSQPTEQPTWKLKEHSGKLQTRSEDQLLVALFGSR
eukprot:1483756-Amphidinium_carterae.1